MSEADFVREGLLDGLEGDDRAAAEIEALNGSLTEEEP